jgi:SAM-dependent methyltransferase
MLWRGKEKNMSSAKSNTEIRETVSRAYARAVEKAQQKDGGCCQPSGCAPAGYGEELSRMPTGAVASSFGCGNPLALADVREGDTVLDLGSGAGLDLLVASKKVGPSGRVIGVDMTDAMLEASRRNIEEVGVRNVEVRKGVIEALPVEDGSVDWVISNCVINLSPEKEKVFTEIARVLKPGGRFSISDIVVKRLPDWLRNHSAVYSACIGGAISEEHYRAGLEEAGLSDVEVSERQVYSSGDLRAIVRSNFDNLGLSAEQVEAGLASVDGNVWSARFTGRKR